MVTWAGEAVDGRPGGCLLGCDEDVITRTGCRTGLRASVTESASPRGVNTGVWPWRFATGGQQGLLRAVARAGQSRTWLQTVVAATGLSSNSLTFLLSFPKVSPENGKEVWRCGAQGSEPAPSWLAFLLLRIVLCWGAWGGWASQSREQIQTGNHPGEACAPPPAAAFPDVTLTSGPWACPRWCQKVRGGSC